MDDYDRFLCSAVAMAHYDAIPRSIYSAAIVNPANSPRRLRVRIPDYSEIIDSVDDGIDLPIDNGARDEEASLATGYETISLGDYTITVNKGEVLPGGISFSERVTLTRQSFKAWHDIGICLEDLRPNKPMPLSSIIGRFHNPLAYHDVHGRDMIKRARGYLRGRYLYADYFAALVIGSVYNAFHITAFSLKFPTLIEYHLWIAATIASALALLCITMALDLLSYLGERKGWKRSAGMVALLIIITVFGLARVYQIAESFASLRIISIGVYRTPIWTQILPHI